MPAAIAVVLVLAATALTHQPVAAEAEPEKSLSIVLAPGPIYDERDEAALKRFAARADRAHRTAPAAPATPPAAAATTAAAPKTEAAPARPAKPRRAAPAPRRARPATQAAVAPADGSPASVVVAYAFAQVGKRYLHGAAGPNAFDCSGLVQAAYSRVGIRTTHYTGTLVGHGRRIGRAELQPGDIVFPEPGHVGIYVGGGRMVHASTPRGGVKLSPVYRFWTARRLL